MKEEQKKYQQNYYFKDKSVTPYEIYENLVINTELYMDVLDKWFRLPSIDANYLKLNLL